MHLMAAARISTMTTREYARIFRIESHEEKRTSFLSLSICVYQRKIYIDIDAHTYFLHTSFFEGPWCPEFSAMMDEFRMKGMVPG